MNVGYTWVGELDVNRMCHSLGVVYANLVFDTQPPSDLELKD